MFATVPDGAALEAAGLVGTWITDVAAGLSVLQGRAAAVLSGDADLEGRPVVMDVALGRIHPEDRDWVFGRIRQVRSTGGPFSAEFRILGADGGVRWILNRGQIRPDATGAMRGCGAYIDTTESHRHAMFPATRPTIPRMVPRGLQDPLDEAAEQCLRAHEAVGRSGQRPLRLLADMLLMEVGRALARRGRL